MGLKYFKDDIGNYIIFKKSNSQHNDNFIKSQLIFTTFALLPKNSSTDIENFLDKKIDEIILEDVKALNLTSPDDLQFISISANYVDLDKENTLFDDIIDLNDIDSENTFYRFTVFSDVEIPLTKKRLIKNPFLVVQSFFETIFRNLSKK